METFTVNGMKCAGCGKKVQNVFKQNNIDDVVISLENKTVSTNTQIDDATKQTIKKQIEELGYKLVV